MQTTEFIWFNGKLVPWHEAKIHVLTHSLHYGGGAFEGIRFYNGVQGPTIFRLAEHADRLIYSAKTLCMPFTYSKEEICSATISLVQANKLQEGYIRPIVFSGYGVMGVNPKNSPVDFAIACWPWGAYLAESVDVKTSSYIRIHPDSTLVSAKLSGHYVNGILASLELRGTHYHEALFLDSQGYISEGPGENFFIVKDGQIYTPQLGTILPGITRDSVMTIAKQQLGLTIIETNITLEEAYAADEAFFTGTAAEVTPIRSIDDKLIGQNSVGPITSQIKQFYSDIVRGKNLDYLSWLTPIEA